MSQVLSCLEPLWFQRHSQSVVALAKASVSAHMALELARTHAIVGCYYETECAMMNLSTITARHHHRHSLALSSPSLSLTLP